MRVLLTGAAGFIGSRVAAALADAGHEVVAVDAMLAAAHGEGAEPPEGVQRVDVRDAGAVAGLLDGVDVVCHQAAVVGAGVDAGDAPSYGSHNDYATTVLLAEMFAAGCQRLVLASSMVVYGQGRFSCAEHGVVEPLPRTRADLDAGVFEHRCPIGGEELEWQLVDEDAPLRPRSLYAASKVAQENYALAWAEATGDRWSRCATTTSTARTCRATLRTRVWRRSSGPRSKQVMCQGFSRTAARCGTSSTSTTSPRPTWRRSRRVSDGFMPANVCSGRPISILEVATELCEARGDVPPLVTGQYRSGDVRHIVASPAGAAELLGFRAVVDPRDGLREFAYAPLRG